MLQPNICHLLVFDGNADIHMLPSITPIRWNTGFDPFRPFGSHNKPAIVSSSDKIPTAISPLISFFNKKIRRKTQLNQWIRRAIFTTWTYLFAPMPWIPRDCFFYFCILHHYTSSNSLGPYPLSSSDNLGISPIKRLIYLLISHIKKRHPIRLIDSVCFIQFLRCQLFNIPFTTKPC